MNSFDQYFFKRILIVAYRLPFKLIRKKEESYIVQNSGGLVSAILSLSEKMKSAPDSSSKILWIGTGEKELGNETIHTNFELHPVEIPRKISERYYSGFCNDTIWPLFHYFPSRTVYDNSYFDAYVTANNLFLQQLKNLIKPGDFIWIHDYQLFLLPEMVRKDFPTADIGFFLHIPFPSYELFRLLPKKWRESLLNGMTGADVVGFHTNDYAQHFIKSVKRTLGYKVERNFITVNDRLCKADAFPIGIDFKKFNDACNTQKTNHQKDKLRTYLSGNKLLFSVDRLDYSKGFILRLRAFERFLEKYPEWHFKVVFNMVVIPSRDNIEGYRELKKEIEATVGRVNGKYSTLNWRPIIYQYKSIPFNELVAIYNISEVGLITPLRDGMNLVAKEYVTCQTDHCGMLVLSEMAGAAVELNEAILINPTDTEETSDAINKALSMSDEEKESRMRKMQNRLSRYNVFRWTTDFFNQVNDVKKEQEHMQVKFMDNNSLNSLQVKYKNAQNRLFLIDYDGTLAPIAKLPEMAVLDEKTRDILRKIISDSRNKVVIISGRRKEFIEEQSKDLNAILVAEHGYFIKYPKAAWENNLEIDLSWKKKIQPILNDYVDRCNGSMVEDKYASVVWHYRNADEEIATLRINELKDDLSEILKSEPKLFVLEGDKVLEVKSILYDKGTVASALISKVNYDFILALGDDRTDEDLFKVIPDNGFTIKVGSKPSNARFNVRSQQQIYEILNLFTDASTSKIK
ncbi:MAG: bifunctional alpha,alpha-trehalose-phosphate synthase (UDP-forming)/trehalose-phosphatase [Bacteroidales bacterium]|jgi:trehalose 6-phosphate synthase/phosphatase|nr:bifunctional alpha,alpha-trehalose-phosphate synthase (UDP-forming)/trehalose-phosphatase [Bacteroidales bacterium]